MHLQMPVRVGGDVVEQIAVEVLRSGLAANNASYLGTNVSFSVAVLRGGLSCFSAAAIFSLSSAMRRSYSAFISFMSSF